MVYNFVSCLPGTPVHTLDEASQLDVLVLLEMSPELHHSMHVLHTRNVPLVVWGDPGSDIEQVCMSFNKYILIPDGESSFQFLTRKSKTKAVL